MTKPASANLIIGVVGPCAAGKSTLVDLLQAQGYQARHIAQEHSFVPDMWQRLTDPDLLVYLDVSFSKAMVRRPQSCSLAEHQEQLSRLKHALQHAHLYLDTDPLTPEEILAAVITIVNRQPRPEV